MNTNAFYGCESWGDEDTTSRVRNISVPEEGYQRQYGDVYTIGKNEVKMVLDMDYKILKYYVNGKDQGIAFGNICFGNDEQYSMCISLDEEMSIQLTDYQHI